MAAAFRLLAIASIVVTGAAKSLSSVGKCRDINFTVSASAQNREIFVEPDFSTAESALDFIGQNVSYLAVSGTEVIAARYCQPPANRRTGEGSNTLQLLVHGLTYDREYFSGLGLQEYSWEAYALDRGYSTLSVDRIGCGKSSRPNGLNMVQAPYQAELMHQLISQLRNRVSGVYRNDIMPFSRLVWVGHSYGSTIGNLLAARHPADIDVFVLTGFAIFAQGDNPFSGVVGAGFKPATDIDPVRFPPTVFDRGYFATSNKFGRMDSFYSEPLREFAQQAFETDNEGGGTATGGEMLTLANEVAKDFSGSVFVFTGQHDAVFCGNGTHGPPIPDCGDNNLSRLRAVRGLFPRADTFEMFLQPRAGHCHNMHFTAKIGFAAAHTFLKP